MRRAHTVAFRIRDEFSHCFICVCVCFYLLRARDRTMRISNKKGDKIQLSFGSIHRWPLWWMIAANMCRHASTRARVHIMEMEFNFYDFILLKWGINDVTAQNLWSRTVPLQLRGATALLASKPYNAINRPIENRSNWSFAMWSFHSLLVGFVVRSFENAFARFIDLDVWIPFAVLRARGDPWNAVMMANVQTMQSFVFYWCFKTIRNG